MVYRAKLDFHEDKLLAKTEVLFFCTKNLMGLTRNFKWKKYIHDCKKILRVGTHVIIKLISIFFFFFFLLISIKLNYLLY